MTSLVTYLTHTKLLEGFAFTGTADFWTCGALFYQLGLFDVVEQAGKRVEKQLEKLGAEKVILLNEHEYIMLKKNPTRKIRNQIRHRTSVSRGVAP